MGFSITGLSGSGLDTAQMVKDLMEIERIPLKTLENKKSSLQTEQTIFRAVNTKLNALNTALNDIKYNFNFNVFKSTSTNNAVVTATSTEGAQVGSYTLDVEEIATKATGRVSGADLLSMVNNVYDAYTQYVEDHPDADAAEIDQNIASIKFGSFEIKASQLVSLGLDSDNNNQLNNIINVINKNSAEAGMKATKIDVSGNASNVVIALESTKTGANGTLSISVADQEQNIITSKVAGKNAKFTLNGVAIERETNTIKDVLGNITLNLTGKGESTVTVSQDVDAIASKIENFVNAYNEVVDLVKNNLSAPEDKDTINPLQGDSLLKDISYRLTSLFNSHVKDGAGNKLGFMEEIGLSIDKGFTVGTTLTSKISFDKTAFTNAMAENPTRVSGIVSTVAYDISSVIQKEWTSSINGMISMKIKGYDSEITMIDERVANMERTLTMREARLNQQFSTMEIMLSSLNSTKDWLTSQFDALTKKS